MKALLQQALDALESLAEYEHEEYTEALRKWGEGNPHRWQHLDEHARETTVLMDKLRKAIEAPKPVETATTQLVESLCKSKGWLHAYAEARVRGAIDAPEPVCPSCNAPGLMYECIACGVDLRAELDKVTTDRDEWKDATICANERFKAAEKGLDRLRAAASDPGTRYHLTHDGVAVVSPNTRWLPIDIHTPHGSKCLVIDQAQGIAYLREVRSGDGFTHWHPLPKF